MPTKLTTQDLFLLKFEPMDDMDHQTFAGVKGAGFIAPVDDRWVVVVDCVEGKGAHTSVQVFDEESNLIQAWVMMEMAL